MNLIKRSAHKSDLIFLALWPVAASIISFATDAGFLVSTLWFFGVPSLVLSLRMPRIVPKLALFAITFGGLFGIIVDYVMELTGGWYSPESVFESFRLFNLVTVDFLVWTILYFYLVILVYEVFLDTEPKHVIRMKRFPYLLRLTGTAFAAFALLYILAPSALFINYFYLYIGAAFCFVPIFLVLWKHPKLLAKFSLTTVYFAAFALLNEITGISLGHWYYPGINQHIGKVSMFGVWFPFEEFVCWILLGGMATLAWYEHFADDNR